MLNHRPGQWQCAPRALAPGEAYLKTTKKEARQNIGLTAAQVKGVSPVPG